jgi:hypothetical protein
MSILWQKEDSFSRLYPKLITDYQNPSKITSEFYDEKRDVNSESVMNANAITQAAIVVAQIYVGSKPSIQLKVNDVYLHEIRPKQCK